MILSFSAPLVALPNSSSKASIFSTQIKRWASFSLLIQFSEVDKFSVSTPYNSKIAKASASLSKVTTIASTESLYLEAYFSKYAFSNV